MTLGLKNPLVFFQFYQETDIEDFQLKAATDMGALIIDGLCDGILLYNNGDAIPDTKIDETAFGILQAGRLRTSSYVGAGRGKISLYRKKECIEKNIPEEQAVEKLLKLIAKDTE